VPPINDNDRLLKTIDAVISEGNYNLGQNDNLFIKRIFSQGISKYTNRLLALGFSDNQQVLDAGCGFGQWTLALSTLNKNVLSCDISKTRIDFLNDLLQCLQVENASATESKLDELPYPNCCFDAIFCYGVIFLTPWKCSLKELHRVLKPGGRLYTNANGAGWYTFLWNEEHNKAPDYDPKSVAAKTFSDTLVYKREGVFVSGMRTIIEKNELMEELDSLGFYNIASGAEGTLHVDLTEAPPKPFFKGRYNGLTGVHEIVAEKK